MPLAASPNFGVHAPAAAADLFEAEPSPGDSSGTDADYRDAADVDRAALGARSAPTPLAPFLIAIDCAPKQLGAKVRYVAEDRGPSLTLA